MPAFYHKELPAAGELGLWRIEEDESYFLDRLELFPSEIRQLSEMKGRRRLEWLASRWLLHEMSGRALRGACLKDSFGKPHLTDSTFEISISHSNGTVAVMAAPYSIGVDLQKEVAKIERIAPKFMRAVESASMVPETKIPHLHLYWGAKEALYKAYGRKELGFRQHLHVNPFKFDLNVGRATGAIHKASYHAYYDIFYERVRDYYLVWVSEK